MIGFDFNDVWRRCALIRSSHILKISGLAEMLLWFFGGIVFNIQCLVLLHGLDVESIARVKKFRVLMAPVLIVW